MLYILADVLCPLREIDKWARRRLRCDVNAPRAKVYGLLRHEFVDSPPCNRADLHKKAAQSDASPLQEQEHTMTIYLDLLMMVPSRNKVAAAKLLAEVLGVAWSDAGVGPFAPVYVNDGLTLDFDEWSDPIPKIHYCFRVDQAEFALILARISAAGIPYRSRVHGPVDFKIDTQHGGSIVYWNEPDGHQWEMLTLSYARQASNKGSE